MWLPHGKWRGLSEKKRIVIKKLLGGVFVKVRLSCAKLNKSLIVVELS